MGFIQAFKGSVGGAFADQWIDFLTVPAGVPPTAALFAAVPSGQNAGRGSNTKASTNVITNGSKIVVPEGYGLVTMENGAITGLVTEPGGFVFSSQEQNSQSVFAGNGILGPTIKTSWERFKFGGQPGSQQLAYFVSLKELPNNRFGTQSEIYWDDAYLNAQVGALARGSYTLKIVDPILFIKNFVPATYLSGGPEVFDFTDFNNPSSEQLFNEVVGSLAAAFSRYTNDPSKGNRITKIQSDSVGFAQSLSATVEEEYSWLTGRGLLIERVTIQAIEYDADTRTLLSDVKKADALSGGRGNSFAQQALARGLQGAGENGGGAGLVGLGMALPMAAGAAGMFQQPAPAPVATEVDPVAKLKQMKELLDAGIVTEEEFAQAKKNLLGF